MNKPIILFAVQSHELKQSIQIALHHQTVELVEATTSQEMLEYFQATKPQLLILESPCQARQDFSRKLKWGPSDFSSEK